MMLVILIAGAPPGFDGARFEGTVATPAVDEPIAQTTAPADFVAAINNNDACDGDDDRGGGGGSGFTLGRAHDDGNKSNERSSATVFTSKSKLVDRREATTTGAFHDHGLQGSGAPEVR
jgi:hypothetical protein